MCQEVALNAEPFENLFVYGTLRYELNNAIAEFLKQSGEYLGAGHIYGRLYDLGSYPGVVPVDNDSDLVRGDIFALYEAFHTLQYLDAYEGCDALPPNYRREKRNIIRENGTSVLSWVYVYAKPVTGLPVIESGDYLEYVSSLKTEMEFQPRYPEPLA